jgi:hypothetical protein
MTRGWVIAVILGGLINTSARAQEVNPLQPAPPPNPLPTGKLYPVSGTVFNSVTQQPIRRALVRIQVGGQQYTAFTGADGRFHLDEVAEGPATITAERPGFAERPWCNPCVNNSTFSVGSGTNDFRLPLIPNGKLTGKVIDEDGEPVVGIAVLMERAQISNGRKQFVQVGAATTDEQGVYQFDDCAPGETFVLTSSHARRMDALVFPMRYYPNSDTRTAAQPISIEPGEEARADFHLAPARLFAVSGTVMNIPGTGGVNIWLKSPDAADVPLSSAGVDQSGRFVLRNVPEGVWELYAQGWGPSQQLQASEEIAVKGANVNRIQLHLQSMAAIPVVVRDASGTSPGSTASVQARLTSATGAANGEYYAGVTGNPHPNQPQALSFENVPPGKYYVALRALGSSCVDSLSYNGTNPGGEPIIVSGQSSNPLVVNIRSDCGTVQVETHGSAQQGKWQLLLVSDLPILEALTTPLASGNATTFANISPGTYKLYLSPMNENLEYTNPEAMRQVPSQEVRVSAGQSMTVTVQLPEQEKP